MISSSLVLYNNDEKDVIRVLKCVDISIIDIVFVIDNSMTDRLKSVVLESTNKAHYIGGHGNIGFGRANNIGIDIAIENNYDYHIILNPDIVFVPDTISKLKSYMDNNPDIGLVKPRLTYADGTAQISASLLPSPFDVLCRRLLPNLFKRRQVKYELKNINLNIPQEVPNVGGCFLFTRINVLKKISGFDSRFFLYFEDFDFVRRIHQYSKVMYYPYVSVVHDHAAAHKHNKKLLIISIKSAIQYYNKWGWIIDRERRYWNRIINNKRC